jgi:hypothetical protein
MEKGYFLKFKRIKKEIPKIIKVHEAEINIGEFSIEINYPYKEILTIEKVMEVYKMQLNIEKIENNLESIKIGDINAENLKKTAKINKINKLSLKVKSTKNIKNIIIYHIDSEREDSYWLKKKLKEYGLHEI